ncbi:MAG TPA: hypothetical protein VEJ44_05580, partial [Acidimicrobiales bacterium]|nr:hypothetical protein [Acidimicrobiales bacterium]
SAAWHWMDPAPTFAEIARVLRPGGVFGVLGTGPNREVDWVGALLDASRRPHGEATDRSRTHAPDLPPDAPFTEPEATVFEYTTPMTRAELVGLAGTYSSVITLPDDERERHLADIDRAVRAALGGTGAPDDATAEVPLRCRCWRTVRR